MLIFFIKTLKDKTLPTYIPKLMKNFKILIRIIIIDFYKIITIKNCILH